MKQLIANLKHVNYKDVSHLILIDTCSLAYIMSHPHKIKELEEFIKKHPYKMALTSFNADELSYIEEKKELDENIRRNTRSFLKTKPALVVVDVPISPGSSAPEKQFVNYFDPEILKLCPDTSDAILISVAIHTQSDILTKDKHHIFTTLVENYVSQNYKINVYKELNEITE